LLAIDWGGGVGWGPEICAVEPDEGPFRLFGGPVPRLLPCSEPAPDEIAQIEPCGAAGQPRVVLDGAAVAQFEAATASAGDLGDDSFHVGPVLAVLALLLP